MHRRRILSAAVLLPPFVLLVHLGTPFQFFLLVLVAIFVGLIEFYAMARAGGIEVLRPLGIVAGLSLSAVMFFKASSGPWLASALAGLVMALFVGLLVGGKDPKGAAVRLSVTLLGVVYVAGLLSFPALLRAMDQGKTYVFYLALVTWAGDIGAFYVGTMLGRHRLSPSISAGKTVEGGVGGLLCSVLASCVARIWFWDRLGLGQSVALGLGLGVVGQVGDLCESMLKRSFGVKDAGVLIPGHGGVLDRVDSVLFTGPVLYLVVLAGLV